MRNELRILNIAYVKNSGKRYSVPFDSKRRIPSGVSDKMGIVLFFQQKIIQLKKNQSKKESKQGVYTPCFNFYYANYDYEVLDELIGKSYDNEEG